MRWWPGGRLVYRLNIMPLKAPADHLRWWWRWSEMVSWARVWQKCNEKKPYYSLIFKSLHIFKPSVLQRTWLLESMSVYINPWFSVCVSHLYQSLISIKLFNTTKQLLLDSLLQEVKCVACTWLTSQCEIFSNNRLDLDCFVIKSTDIQTMSLGQNPPWQKPPGQTL